MKLELNTSYKSLDRPFMFEIPSLTIITGLNGSGKSQLLQGINSGAIFVTENGNHLTPKKLVTANTLSPNDSAEITREKLNDTSKKIWDKFNQIQTRKRTFPSQFPSQALTDTEMTLVEKIAQNANKVVNDLELNDFYKYYPIDDNLNIKDIFHQNFSVVFKRYFDKLNDNDYDKFLNESQGRKDVSYLDVTQFYKKYGEPPWDFVNKIVSEANLDYQFNSPMGNHRDAPFGVKLISSHTGAEIKLQDLSSGEKVIMSLTLALYNSDKDMIFPKVLLMDEPDASLHPSMVKQFLDVVQNVLVREKHINVIITTHSPSTIALSPEDSIYIMNKSGIRLEKASKDKALKLLTAGVPSLSINYENRKQVFVESKHDVFVYEKIYSKLKEHLISEVSLNFISSGSEGSGSSEQVKKVVNQLSNFGNKSIFGIIDYDNKNHSNKFVKVLGEGMRYSIENYLFDPILLSAFLLREKLILRTDLGLKENENYIDFKFFESQRLQSISDIIVEKFHAKITNPKNCKIKIRYFNNLEIEIPKWYTTIQGHELEQQIKSIFPELKKYTKEDELKREIVTKVIDDIPEFIPYDIYKLFTDIQTD